MYGVFHCGPYPRLCHSRGGLEHALLPFGDWCMKMLVVLMERQEREKGEEDYLLSEEQN